MTKYLTPANGDIVERDDVPESLVTAGIYVPVVTEEKHGRDDEQTLKRHKPRR